MDIKELKTRLGSTERLAAEVGVSFFTAQKWILGYTKPSRLAQREIDRIIKDLQKGEEK